VIKSLQSIIRNNFTMHGDSNVKFIIRKSMIRFQAFAAVQMRSLLFWVVMQRMLVVV
jgi:hypothetical protein